ncbi:hypothetical protein JCM10213_002143 [Rhodosporidiobolus nylandii]
MPLRGSFSDTEDDIALRAADELLALDDRRSSTDGRTTTAGGGGRRPSAPFELAQPGSSKALLASYGATVLFATLSARQLGRLARHSRLTTLLFPLSHFGALSALAILVECLRSRGRFGAGAEGVTGRGGTVVGEGAASKIAYGAGAASALSMALRLWEVRQGETRLCEALEVFVLPTLIALLPYASTALRHGGAQPSPSFNTAAAACCFLVGFALIGVPASGVGLSVGVLRLPVDAAALLLLKEGLGGDAPTSSFLKRSAIARSLLYLSHLSILADPVTVQAATLASVLALPFSLLASPEEAARTLDSAAYVSLSATLLLSLLAQITILFSLHLFSSTSTTAASVFPRNLALLIASTFGREGVALRENWMQVVLVYAVGALAVMWTDSEVVGAAKEIRSGGEGSNYLPLNGNGQEPPGAPTSPSLGLTYQAAHPRKSSGPNLHGHASARPSVLALVPFLPLLVYLITTPATTSSISSACSYLPPSLRTSVCPASASVPTSRTIDLVVSYYDEDLERTKKHIEDIRATDFVSKRSSRVIIYNKGARGDMEIREAMQLQRADEVVPLPNLGREGATYLKHILLHYNATVAALSPSFRPSSSPSLAATVARLRTTTLADHTYFLQPHLAWESIARPRLQLVAPETGFAHFGPMLRSDCGKDGRIGADFPIVKELYNIFVGEVCPPSGQLSAWSAQFAVSKRRILANSYVRYAAIDELLEAPEGHWIHDMWGPNESGGPSNPAVGHSVERAWPVIFGCADPKIADECPDDVFVREKCQCLDV